MVVLTDTKCAGPGLQGWIKLVMPKAHLRIQGQAPGHHPAAGLGALLPIVHVVLLEGTRRAKTADAGQAQGLFDLGRSGFVSVDPRRDDNLVGSMRVPDAEGAGSGTEHREV